MLLLICRVRFRKPSLISRQAGYRIQKMMYGCSGHDNSQLQLLMYAS
jgi:hypothetical protein